MKAARTVRSIGWDVRRETIGSRGGLPCINPGGKSEAWSVVVGVAVGRACVVAEMRKAVTDVEERVARDSIAVHVRVGRAGAGGTGVRGGRVNRVRCPR